MIHGGGWSVRSREVNGATCVDRRRHRDGLRLVRKDLNPYYMCQLLLRTAK